MTNEQFQIAFRRYFEGQINEEERRMMMQHIAALEDDKLETVMRENWFSFNIPDEDLSDSHGRALLKQIFEGEEVAYTEPIFHKPIPTLVNLRRWWAAASVLFIVGIGTYWIVNQKKDVAPNVVKQRAAVIPAGKEGAILTLADGRQLLLDTIADGIVARQKGTIVKVVNGKLIYEGGGIESLYNTTSTPKGRQYQLILSDGTKVWLNADASITYPVQFNHKMREVEVSGEVFFDVTHTGAPFTVLSRGQRIEVLGAQFNINAYDDEPVVKTTLLKGSVMIQTPASNLLLKPGEQAIVKGQQITTIEADMQAVIAWREGDFVFNHTPLRELMRSISRWYDVEMNYDGYTERQDTFSGVISRSRDLSAVLKLMETTHPVKFRVEGKKIFIIN